MKDNRAAPFVVTKGVHAEDYQVLNELADILAENDKAEYGCLPKLTKSYI